MIPTTTHVLPLTTVRRERLLSQPGVVMVAEGTQVQADTIVAKTVSAGKHFVYDLVKRLGVKPEEASQYVKVKLGAEVDKGKVLAVKTSMLGDLSIKAPGRGRVIAIDGGRMLYEANGPVMELRAGFGGQVVAINGDWGVSLETTASLVQGLWGSGRQDYGVLKLLTDDRAETISPELLTGCAVMLVVGSFATEAALKAAVKAKIKGMLLGSLPSSFIPLARALPYPILLTEGFGQFAIAEPTWTLLIGQNGREALLDARPTDRWIGHRPELIVPLPTPYAPPPPPLDAQTLEEGRRVRLLRAPYYGQIGTVQSLPEGYPVFPSGLQTRSVLVDIEGSTVEVPLDNVEVFD